MESLGKEQFSTRMVILSHAFRVEIREAMIEAYWQRLRQFDPILFDKVCDWFLDEGERFPLISDFHKVARRKFSREIDGGYTIRHD